MNGCEVHTNHGHSTSCGSDCSDSESDIEKEEYVSAVKVAALRWIARGDSQEDVDSEKVNVSKI
jgi:hypothetical protein